MVVPAAVLIQFCVGSLYAWSIFNKPIDELLNTQNMAPITFYIACGFLGGSAALTGPWLERRGPRLACLLGIALFCSGHFLTALALYLKQIWLVFLGYGVLGGMGTGLCYISPVSTLQKWFPDHRGMASGLAVCGFGGGSIVIAKIQNPLINSVGLPLTFVILGGCYLLVMSSCAVVLRTPPPNFMAKLVPTADVDTDQEKGQVVVCFTNGCDYKETVVEVQPDLIDCLLSTDFRLMFIMFVGSILFGICAISRLSNMVTDIFGKTREEASTIVSINGGFNLLGRLFFAVVSDLLGRKTCFWIMLTTQLCIVASFSFITSSGAYWSFVVAMWILTACYGGGFGTIPAFLTDMFGPSNVGACHGVILTDWSIAAVVGGLTYTKIFDLVSSSDGHDPSDPRPYNVNSWWILAVVATSWIALQLVTPTEKDVRFRRFVLSGCRNNRPDPAVKLTHLKLDT